MGGDSSKLAAVAAAEKMFTSQENDVIKKQLNEMMVSPKAVGFNQSAWEAYVGEKLCKELQENLFAIMLWIENEAGIESPRLVAPGGYVISLSHFLKGSISEKATLVSGLCNTTGRVTPQNIHKMLKQLLEDYSRYVTKTDNYSTWKLESCDEDAISKLADSMIADLPNMGSGSAVIEIDALERWLSTSVLLLQILARMMHFVFPVMDEEIDTRVPLFPRCEQVHWDKHSTMLNIPRILFLNQYVPSDLRTPWRLCFATEVHGESFSNLVKHIVDQGPSIMLVQDTQGHVFGGFASESWELGSHFVGDTRSFLFRILPEMTAYHPTGINENFMYFNQSQETMPNGIGFGGQLGYFGLWLDSEFGKGNSMAEPRCTTFNSPQLSKDTQFEVQALEIWALGMDPKLVKLQDEEGNEKKESILDKDPAAKAMLSLLGKGPLSEGLRETDPMASSPEDHKQFPS